MMSAMSAFNKSMGAETMSEVTRSADRMVASAKSGGFQVTKEAADPIIKVLEDFIDQIESMRSDLTVFDQMPSLGAINMASWWRGTCTKQRMTVNPPVLLRSLCKSCSGRVAKRYSGHLINMTSGKSRQRTSSARWVIDL